VWLTTGVANERSQRAFAKAGFTREGTLRSTQFDRGSTADAVVMSILRDEWEALPRPRSWDHP
jgi:RimJ/RimL family protein N-acetyltransferase